MSDTSSWYCRDCQTIAIEVIGRDVSARLTLDHMRVEHKAWHKALAAEAHGVTA